MCLSTVTSAAFPSAFCKLVGRGAQWWRLRLWRRRGVMLEAAAARDRDRTVFTGFGFHLVPSFHRRYSCRRRVE